MIDPHCHILPSCDDGSSDLTTSIQMLEEARKNHITKIIATPHIRHHYCNPQKNLAALKKLKPHANKLDMDITLGHEVHWKKLSEVGFEYAKGLKLGKSNLFLLEFSWAQMPVNWQKVVRILKNDGLDVVIVHPERYKEVQNNYKVAYDLKNAGCKLMLSASYVDKERFGPCMPKAAKKMLKKGLIDFIASDAHRPQSYRFLPEAMATAHKYGYNDRRADRLLEAAF